MRQTVIYRFPSAPKASRFLAELKAGSAGECKSRRYPDDCAIEVEYVLAQSHSFNQQAQRLDDLAESLGGEEAHS
jgi:hypothetical protein